MYQKFIKAITWNSINVFLYKSILLTHQIVLFHFISKDLYGTSGTIFSSIYLLIGISTVGFDYALYALFSIYIQSKKTFKKLIIQYIAKLIITIFIATFIAALMYSNLQIPLLLFFQKNISLTIMPIVLLIFITESMRKSIETTAQLLFLNQSIACIQVSMILLYTIMIWTSYFYTGFISLYIIFIPMLIISTLETVLTSSIIYNVYKQLPKKSSYNLLDQKPTFIREQSFNYINQTAKNIFSPNFLLVFVAYNMGMGKAGYVRFFTNIITLLYMLLTRSVGIPTGALFSKLLVTPLSATQSSFVKITNTYIQVLYFFAITILVTILPYLQQHEMTPHILLFIALGFVEYITITYEKLFVVQKHSKNLAFINAASIILLFIYLLFIKQNIVHSLIILPILLIRVTSAIYIGYYAFKVWKVSPVITIRKQTLLLSILVASIISFFIKIYQLYI